MIISIILLLSLLYLGFYDSSFSGYCIITTKAHVARSSLANILVEEFAEIINCSSISCDTGSSYGIQTIIEVGPESAGRKIRIHPGMRYQDCVHMALNPSDHSSTYPLIAGEHLGYIGSKVSLMNCESIRNSLIAGAAVIANASLESTVILNDKTSDPVKIRGGAQISYTTIHSGVDIPSSCIIDHAFLCENTSVGEYARLHHVVLGPDNSISGGECHHSILGPFIGFHHQSLLIACLWPHGRGNIAYGAMIGSNHSGRVNDQECWMGEGVFVGLDVTIRYPFNCIESPYTMIATGTTCQSQRIACPFSLLMNAPNDGLRNLIKPAWILTDNPYYLERCILKYAKRRKSIHHRSDHPVLRPSIIGMIHHAMMRLEDIISSSSTEIISMGKCLCTMDDASAAVAAYKKLLQRYALLLLIDPVANRTYQRANGKVSMQLEIPGGQVDIAAWSPDSVAEKPAEAASISADTRASYDNDTRVVTAQLNLHRLQLMQHLIGSSGMDISCEQIDATVSMAKIVIREDVLIARLEMLLELEAEHTMNVCRSRNKDNNRGCEVIPDYAVVNEFMRTGSDSVIDAVCSRVDQIKGIILDFKSSLA
jgi:hypothetical protein